MTVPSSLDPAARELLLSRIRDIPDWPEQGIVFKDITPLLADHEAFRVTVDALAAAGRDATGEAVVDRVVGIEARGFILAAPVALALNAGLVLARKAGKLPYETMSTTYQLEYGHETIEMHRDALRPGDRVLIVDDVLATGGTAEATANLVRGAGAEPVAVSVLLALGILGGRSRLGTLDVRVLLEV